MTIIGAQIAYHNAATICKDKVAFWSFLSMAHKTGPYKLVQRTKRQIMLVLAILYGKHCFFTKLSSFA